MPSNRLSPYERRLIAAVVLATAAGAAVGAAFGWRLSARPPVTSLPGHRQCAKLH